MGGAPVLHNYKLRKLWVVYPGSSAYPIHKKAEVIPLQKIPPRWEYS